MRHARDLAAIACTLATAASLAMRARAQQPEAVPFRLQLVPAAVQLDDGRDQQRVVALGVRADGATIELADVVWAPKDKALVAIEPRGNAILLRPLRDGATELVARWHGQEVCVPVRVRDVALSPRISFRNEVVPTLTAAGCNAGSCHGAASGKNGFRLSLFGYDPGRDHRMLTRDLRGRRLDFAAPEQSLMLQKATAGAVHQGGKRLAVDDASYRRLCDWIAGGADDDAEHATAITGIDVEPAHAVLIGTGAHLPLSVRARYRDGSDRDVTALVRWSTGNEAVARIDGDGRLVMVGRGEAAILARFAGQAAIAQVRVHLDDAPFVWPELAAGNFVDQHLQAKLRRARTLPMPSCSDAVFLRRVHLDLVGVLPTPAESRAFLDDRAADKRARLVDALLARPEFAAVQAAQWADVLQVDAQTMEKKGAVLLGRWLRAALLEHRPFDEVVRELLTADGETFSTAPANFQLIAATPNLVAEKAAQVFLGVRLQCAQCHDHPFERWTMDDYYGFAAFFGQVGKRRGRDPYEQIVWNRGDGEVRNLRNGAVMPPRLLGAGEPKIAPGADRRAVLAQWLACGDNPWFARNVVNRTWARMFGRGLIDPVDDARIGNPPSHPELLDALAQLFVDAHFDIRPVVRAIATSAAYRAALAPADAERSLFAGLRPRRLQAEPLLDAIAAVTLVPTKYPGVPLGGAASELDGGRGSVRFLDAFGRPGRDSVCTCDRRDEPTLGQTLHLINGDTIAGKINDAQGRLRRAQKEQQPPAAMLEDLFLAAYCRRPTEWEETRVLAIVQASADVDAAWQDVYWSVLNSKEFLFQH